MGPGGSSAPLARGPWRSKGVEALPPLKSTSGGGEIEGGDKRLRDK